MVGIIFMYRAKEVFNVKKAIVVTQEYHLYRALYICDKMRIEAYGARAYPHIYPGRKYRMVREWFARDKAILSCLLRKNIIYIVRYISVTK